MPGTIGIELSFGQRGYRAYSGQQIAEAFQRNKTPVRRAYTSEHFSRPKTDCSEKMIFQGYVARGQYKRKTGKLFSLPADL